MRSCPKRTMTSAIALSGDAAEVALGEAQAVLAMISDDERRGRLADLIAAVGDGEIADADADALTELLELGLQTGRLRAVYGPDAEELDASARDVTGALASLVGKPLENARIEAAGPGSFLVSLSVDGLDVSIRLDRQGARLTSVGV